MICFKTLTQAYMPTLMGIANITPDSFSDGGKIYNCTKAHQHIQQLINENVAIIDIGTESTRPQSTPITAETEIERLNILKLPLKSDKKTYFSIDTYKAKTAEFALNNGFHIVNDIMGLRNPTDKNHDMARIVADHGAGIIIMYNHLLTAQTSQNIIQDALNGFERSLEIADKFNIPAHHICLDVGIGFGTQAAQNITLIKNISTFKKLGFPILIGASRKSFIQHYLNITDPEKRLYATISAHSYAYSQGAQILRVHDVKAHDDYFRMHHILDNFSDQHINQPHKM